MYYLLFTLLNAASLAGFYFEPMDLNNDIVLILAIVLGSIWIVWTLMIISRLFNGRSIDDGLLDFFGDFDGGKSKGGDGGGGGD